MIILNKKTHQILLQYQCFKKPINVVHNHFKHFLKHQGHVMPQLSAYLVGILWFINYLILNPVFIYIYIYIYIYINE